MISKLIVKQPFWFIALLLLVLSLIAPTFLAAQDPGDEQTVLFRVNAGGEAIAAEDNGPEWSGDTLDNRSIYLSSGGDFTNGFEVGSVDSSVPASTPQAIFETERWDAFGGEIMLWQFPVAAGTPVEIRIYLMNGFEGTSTPGSRVFNIEIDGLMVFSDIDLAADPGHQIGTVRSYETIADGSIDIRLLHGVDNPLINGIEIVQTGPQADVLSVLPTRLDFGQVLLGSEDILTMTLRNLGTDGDPAISIDEISISDPAFAASLEPDTLLEAGEQVDIAVTFSPDSIGPASGVLSISHSGSNSPVTVDLAGEGVDEQAPPPFAFLAQTLTSRLLPTQLEFGPDGRLYVAELDGLIYAFTVERQEESGEYSILDAEVIDLLQAIPNHNDDGTPFVSTEGNRNVTGMITAGTASNPVVLVTSSDPRNNDPNADTNSGILTRLTRTDGEWTRLDLVRSLPRSWLNHFPNGLALDADNGILYLAQGGHTNMGAPSSGFNALPEYALSGAILSIDLNAIGNTTYDVPTLKGEVFGGQGGDNQAVIVADGPVQVHAPGFRNPYDVLLTSAGRLYAFDRPTSLGWGGVPIAEGPTGVCTNELNEAGSADHPSNLHLIDGLDYYAGQPNPTRANRDNTFDELSPIPEGLENPVECEFRIPGVEDGAIFLLDAATHGLAEYTATNFDGEMVGNIIVTVSDGRVLRLSLNPAGDEVIEHTALFTGLNGPQGLATQGDTDIFPGTIWIAEFFTGNIIVFEPEDFSIIIEDRIFQDRFEATEP